MNQVLIPKKKTCERWEKRDHHNYKSERKYSVCGVSDDSRSNLFDSRVNPDDHNYDSECSSSSRSEDLFQKSKEDISDKTSCFSGKSSFQFCSKEDHYRRLKSQERVKVYEIDKKKATKDCDGGI